MKINAEEAMSDKDSIFYHYKKLIQLRKEHDVISYGTFNMILEEHNKVLAYVREYEGTKLIVLNNYYGEETKVNMSKYISKDNRCEILISNYQNSMELGEEIKLRPYESIAYIIK